MSCLAANGGLQIWNGNLTAGDFSDCFEDTFFSIIPDCILVVFAAFRLHYLSKRAIKKWASSQWHTTANRVLAALVTVIAAASLAMKVSSAGTAVVAEAFHLVASIAAFAMLFVEHMKTRRASTALLVYWLVFIVVDAIRVRTWVLEGLNSTQSPSFALLIVALALYVLQFVFECFTSEQEEDGSRTPPLPLGQSSNVFSRITYSHFQHLMTAGAKRPLTFDDLWTPEKNQRAAPVFAKFSVTWAAQLKKAKPSLLLASIQAFPTLLIISFVQSVIILALEFLQPFLLSNLIDFVASSPSTAKNDDGDLLLRRPAIAGYAIAFTILAAGLLSSILSVQAWMNQMAFGFLFRTSVAAAVYRKAMRLSPGGRAKTSTGQVLNHIQGDTQHVQWSVQICFLPLLAPIKVVIAMALLWQQLGPAALGGVAVIVLAIPLGGWMGKVFENLYGRKMEWSDKRINLTNELINAILGLKLNGWDKSMRERVGEIRKGELANLAKVGMFKSAEALVSAVTPLLVTLVSFAVHAAMGRVLTPTRLFVSFNLFNLITASIQNLAQMFSTGSGALASIKRLQKFLLLEELDPAAVNHLATSDHAIRIASGTFRWEEASADGSKTPKPVLEEINFTAARGTLTAVCGRVGQGKSSLIAAITGEMYKLKGEVELNGSVAYVAQSAWIENATLKDNILFGSEYDEKRYNAVIEACALESDLKQLEAGDMTEIGERGVNLSGGQKQRVSLARAVYADADIYLLDDCLSAVDAHVDAHIFARVIGPNGILAAKTRLLVTNGLHHLHETDQIVVLTDGTISEVGTFAGLMADGGAFRTLVDEFSVTISETESSSKPDPNAKKDPDDATTVEPEEVEKKEEDDTKPISGDGKLVQEEKAAVGRAAGSVYWKYLHACGYPWLVLSILLLIAAQGSSVASTVWLGAWSTAATDPNRSSSEKSSGYYLGIYGSMVAAAALLAFACSLAMRVVCGLRSAKIFHDKMLVSVLRSPMSWFESTLVGQITNRFSGDTSTVDENLVESFVSFLTYLISALSIICVVSATTPLFLILLPPIGGLYYCLQNYYLKTSREIKRLAAMSSSPVNSLANATVTGASTIRAYGRQKVYGERFRKLQDVTQSTFLMFVGTNKWLQVRLECIGALVAFGAALFIVIERDSVTSAMAGLSLGYAFQINEFLYHCLRLYGDIENSSTTLERLIEFHDLPSEAPEETDVKLPQGWPSKGAITLTNVSLRHRPTSPLVLKNLNLSIAPSEKIGIVGRTGAGKTTLSLALFRIKEIESSGTIEIDGVDAKAVGLIQLRSRMTVIPQDPVLLGGRSVRENLDPEGRHDDAALWAALEASHLKRKFLAAAPSAEKEEVKDGEKDEKKEGTKGEKKGEENGGKESEDDKPAGLDTEIQSGGENLSVGERQLFCLARALLRGTRILVMDEATAGVDLETDRLVQETIRREFKNATVLTVAHRIRTIMDSDRVIVLDKGEVIEVGNPRTLLEKDGSAFAALARNAGI
ncbi:hypothetical protein HK101_011774 [Irineochytrium annulatum]|nr:hypothetical protein HK101_011774 [Irineochytrium annulatum]